MAPPRGRKRKSNESTMSETHDATAPAIADQKIPTKTGATPSESPSKRRKVGITLAQKQALIDNLQLEITERARKLRAQYNLQAQGLRTRIEIRVNRIPLMLRKAKMGELLQKHSADQQQPPKPTAGAGAIPLSASTGAINRPPPVPEKDFRPARSAAQAPPSPVAAQAPVARAAAARAPKRTSDQMDGGDKENQDVNIDNPKKRLRGNPPLPAAPSNPPHVLSPTSSNLRVNKTHTGNRNRANTIPAVRDQSRPASPTKSLIARPASPSKPPSTATSLLGNMVEKARSTTRAAATRKATASSTASSNAAGAATATTTRTRRGAAAAAPAKTVTTTTATTTTTTRTTRRVSGISESSEGSTSTVVRRTGRGAAPRPASAAATTAAAAARAAAPTPAAKRTVMGTIRKGVTSATTRKAPAAKTAASTATTRSGRVLRKRD